MMQVSVKKINPLRIMNLTVKENPVLIGKTIFCDIQFLMIALFIEFRSPVQVLPVSPAIRRSSVHSRDHWEW